MAKAWLLSLAAGAISLGLLLTASVSVTGLLASLLVPMPLFVVGLSHGWVAALAAGGAMVAGLFAVGGLPAAGMGTALYAGPVTVLVHLALLSRTGSSGKLEWYPAGLLMSWLSAIAGLWVVIGVVFLAGHASGPQQALSEYIGQVLNQAVPAAGEVERQALAQSLSSILLGMAAALQVVVTVVAGILAQVVLQRFGQALRPSPDFAAAEPPQVLAAVLTVVILVALVLPGTAAGFAARNLIVVLAVPYFFVGLGVIHTLTRHINGRGLVLVFVYVMLVVMAPLALFITGLGLVEQVARLRERSRRHGGQQEDD